MDTTRLLATVAASALLAACATHGHRLAADASPEFLRGEFHHGVETHLTLETATRHYEASGFGIRRDSNLAELQRRYRGSDPKHWERIFSGQDKDHETLSAEVAVVASDGSRLDCYLDWSAGSKPAGHCRDESRRELPVRFD